MTCRITIITSDAQAYVQTFGIGSSMMQTVQAIYENGVFRPLTKVDLQEPCEVDVEYRPRMTSDEEKANLEAIYQVLSRSYDSGITDTAARHNEHQP